MSTSAIELHFSAGTLEILGCEEGDTRLPACCLWDERTLSHRAPARDYATVVLALHRAGLAYDDRARDYQPLAGGLVVHREPRPYQSEALQAWQQHGGRGVVVLPTGAGKSHVACMAIDAKRRATLVVAPTLDLVRQWYDLLRVSFGVEVGVIGGGEYQLEALTVTTYDSAYLHMHNIGDRFGMVVFDECHHLPGDAYSLAAEFCLAPYRLGLSATPERADGRDAMLAELIGPQVKRARIDELSGDFLADYEVIHISVDLDPEERELYLSERGIYRDFVRRSGIRMSSKNGWSDFIIRASQSDAGVRALAAYRTQKRLSLTAKGKIAYVEHLLHEHRHDRILIFTQENDTAYQVSRRFLVPAITHQTKIKERSDILARLADGTYGAVVTSKVLNEGVDVPAANVAIVMAGSGSVREHVQRLGRILRKHGDKRALLYELVTADTIETFVSERRREHDAYR
jgi:superfamily II DNA or RNA helicase